MHVLLTSAGLALAATVLASTATAQSPTMRPPAPKPPVATRAMAPSPFAGRWKLDLVASTFTSGPAMRGETRLYQPVGDRMRMVSTGSDAQGRPTRFSYTAAYDGRFYPMVGNPVGDRIALRRVDARTIDATVRKGAETTAYARVVVSPDGKRLAMTRRILRGPNKPAVDDLSYVRLP